MLSRGRYANHAWLQVTGDGDPHTRIHTETLAPATPTEILETVLARDDSPISATTQLMRAHDPAVLLGQAVDRYNDAVRQVAAEQAGPTLAVRLDQAAEDSGVPLTDATAWLVLKSHLLVLHAAGWDPLQALSYALRDPLRDADDPAAVVDRRLDVYDLRSTDTGRPLPWLPCVPVQLLNGSAGEYLARRRDLVTTLADRTREDARATTQQPAWAAALGTPPDADVIAEIEVWRAAHHVPESDLRPTGPARHHLTEAREQHRLNALLAGESSSVLAWIDRIQQAAPDTIGDPSLVRAARECAATDPDGSWLAERLRDETRKPLPDEHKVDALRYRLDAWINPTWEIVDPKAGHDPRHDEHRPPTTGRSLPR